MSFSKNFKMAVAVLVALPIFLAGAFPAFSQTDQSQAQSSITGSYNFSWQAQNTDGIIALSGSVPSESLQRFLLIRAGEGGSETLTIARGAPDAFISSSIAGLDALKNLTSGKFYFSDDIWTLEGTAPSEEEKASIFAVLTRAVETSDWTIEIDTNMAASAEQAAATSAALTDTPETTAVAEEDVVQETAETTETAEPVVAQETQKPAKPTTPLANPAYRFDALRADGTQTSLSGNLPAEAFASYVSKVAGDVSIESIEILAEAPANFRINTITGLKALNQLRSGLFSYQNGQWTLVGDALNEQIREQARQSILALTGSGDWVLNIATVPAREICKLSIAQFTDTKTILFAPASAELTAESTQNLTELATSLNACEQAAIYVSGHTDSDGPAEDNMALSVARAEAVVNALIEAGVDDSRLYAVGYGETLPVATNETRAGKALNRRIVFELADE